MVGTLHGIQMLSFQVQSQLTLKRIPKTSTISVNLFCTNVKSTRISRENLKFTINSKIFLITNARNDIASELFLPTAKIDHALKRIIIDCCRGLQGNVNYWNRHWEK